MSRDDPHRNTQRVETDAKLAALVASLSPYDQLKLIRLCNEQFAWSDAWGEINAGCNQIQNELLADNAAANGYALECGL